MCMSIMVMLTNILYVSFSIADEDNNLGGTVPLLLRRAFKILLRTKLAFVGYGQPCKVEKVYACVLKIPLLH